MAERKSVFNEIGFDATIESICDEIRVLYQDDAVPWVIGYSGGKDSTAIVQLVWLALQGLPAQSRTKPVHVISTDTLVENPVVATWVAKSLERLARSSAELNLPIHAQPLTPDVSDTFWVNLIGKGYPAPRNKFRWCTERMKIKPSNNFIRDTVRANGEAILVLGTRKAESSKRHATMKKHEAKRVRERLSPNSRLTNCMIYTPIEDWHNDDVWQFLMQIENPWGHSNKDLLGMYRGASEDGECPLVVDESTPSCGNSRFGCWTCTLVDQDKSMAAMIQNDVEKEWMEPLLDFRNKLDFRSDDDRKRDRANRDFRRITGKVTYQQSSVDGPKLVHGPYTQQARANWLRELLETQRIVNELAPDDMGYLELIRQEELEEIRRIWVVDKHEVEDLVPEIYEKALGREYPGPEIHRSPSLGSDALEVLRELTDSPLAYEMIRNLLDAEERYRTQAKRRFLFNELEQIIESCFYDSEEDALDRARSIHEAKSAPVIEPMDPYQRSPEVPTETSASLFPSTVQVTHEGAPTE